MSADKFDILFEAYYDIDDKNYTEIIIWTIQLIANSFAYHKYLSK